MWGYLNDFKVICARRGRTKHNIYLNFCVLNHLICQKQDDEAGKIRQMWLQVFVFKMILVNLQEIFLEKNTRKIIMIIEMYDTI